MRLTVAFGILVAISGQCLAQGRPDFSPADRAAPRTDANSRLAHEQLLAKAKQGKIDVYFEGDSITRRWGATDYPKYLANWKENFNGWNAADFGWGADRIENILWRLENGELDDVDPKIIVIQAGTNNIGGPPGDETRVADIARGLKAVVDICVKKAPHAVIIVTAIFPRNDNPNANATINKVNDNLAQLADGKNIRYLNINDKLADADGKLFTGMMNADRLHPDTKGYQVWADALKPMFTELLGPPAETDQAPPPTGDPGAARRGAPQPAASARTRTSINEDWRFTKGDPAGNKVSLLYDVRPAARNRRGAPPADATPAATADVVKAWVLPNGNSFLKDTTKAAQRPPGNLGEGVPYIASDFDDTSWRKLDLPHDYAIEGPFSTAGGGGMGRLPSSGVVWYRKTLSVPAGEADKRVLLDIDGAMSYSMVWLNGQFVGGWPFGYASFRLDLTPYIRRGENNTLAIRLDSPPNSSRWYPGGGIYRNVWLVETAPVHAGQWGTYVTTPDVTLESASVRVTVNVDNDSKQDTHVSVRTQIFEIDRDDRKTGEPVASIAPVSLPIGAGKKETVETKTTIAKPKLWGVGPRQKPNRYVAVTTLEQGGKLVDTYETPFGVRSLKFDANEGFFLNGEHVKLQGVCNHHDLGARAAVNVRALERQLQMLAEMGCNALRMSHNPPAPELLELADKMGFLVMDEAFDVWVRQKTQLDFHLVYPDWHEQDLRALIRRDRNHPSVIMWSIGNEVGEQLAGEAGATIAKELTTICHEEDPFRPTITAMNSARAASPFPAGVDTIGLNYQGAGLYRRGDPQYAVFHQAYPDKLVLGSETAATVSSRGVYTFPVTSTQGEPASANAGEEVANKQVSSYDLYHASWSYPPDKEFAAEDRQTFVAGEFVWTGFDYLGEPTPFDTRSSYFGIIDLAGFKKDRFYLYQAYWRPEHPMAHIVPHWTWPDRVGEVTPVHVYTSGNEADLFLNGKSLGRKTKAEFEYRLRWDDVAYEPGELRVVAYRDGKEWATDTVKTAGAAEKLLLTPDRATIAGDGKDLSFVTLTVADKDSQMVPRSMNLVNFEISGPGEIVATDNGDPTDMTAFPSKDRKAFNGLALVIVRPKRGQSGRITVTAKSEGLQCAEAALTVK